MPITITKILDAQRIDVFRREILHEPERSTSRFVENEDNVLLRVSTYDQENLQIVMTEVLRPSLLNLTYHCKTVRHPELTKSSKNGAAAPCEGLIYVVMGIRRARKLGRG